MLLLGFDYLVRVKAAEGKQMSRRLFFSFRTIQQRATPRGQKVVLNRFSATKSNVCDSSDALAINGIPVPPAATWSISDLRLSAEQSSVTDSPSITYDDLNVLAKRSTIDLNYYRKFHGEDGINSLRRSLDDMIRCLSVVTEFSNTRAVDASPEEMYDIPEGVRAPLRPDEYTKFAAVDSQQLESFHEVYPNQLRGSVSDKLVEINGQKYFHIDRKR